MDAVVLAAAMVVRDATAAAFALRASSSFWICWSVLRPAETGVALASGLFQALTPVGAVEGEVAQVAVLGSPGAGGGGALAACWDSIWRRASASAASRTAACLASISWISLSDRVLTGVSVSLAQGAIDGTLGISAEGLRAIIDVGEASCTGGGGKG